MEANDYKGKWWLPAKPEKKVAGILYYRPGADFRLELIGSFDSENDDTIAMIFGSQNEEIIHGQASDGTRITLFDSICHAAHIGRADFSTVVYKAREVAFGMHLNCLDDKRFFKAVVNIPELSYWLNPHAIQQVHTETDNGHGFYIYVEDKKSEEKEVARTEIRKNLSTCLCRNAIYNSGELLLKPIVEQYTSLQIESSSNLSMMELYKLAVRFEQFMSLAAMRNVGFSELRLYSKDNFFTIGETQRHYKPVLVDTSFHQQPGEKKIEKHKFLFDYLQIAELYPSVLKKWFSNDWKFDAIRGHFLESIDYKGPFSYINFLTVIQAVEGYGNRYLRKAIDEYNKSLPLVEKRKRLHNILMTIIRQYKDVKAVNQSMDLEAIVQTRNYHSHLLAQKGQKWVDGLDLYDLTDELRKVLICCILTYLGFSNQLIDNLTSNCYNDLFRG